MLAAIGPDLAQLDPVLGALVQASLNARVPSRPIVEVNAGRALVNVSIKTLCR
jgi:hypothetical protein